MGSISWARARAAHGVAPHDELDDLRASFEARIQRERVRLVALSAELARADGDTTRIYDELISRAHKLELDAETLELPALIAAANSLQQAAYCASLAHADNTDPYVWASLIELVSLLGTFKPLAHAW